MEVKKNIGIALNGDGGFRMNFLSSSLVIPDGPGAKVIAPSCGDGKTTLIKDIILRYFPYGVLVSVGTIEEAEMYTNYVKTCVVGQMSYGVVMTADKLVSLHSNNQDKVSEYIYSSNPMDIMNKYVVICTHHKLLNNDPRLLINVNKDGFRESLSIPNRPQYDPSLYNGSWIYQALGHCPSGNSLSIIGNDGIARRQFVIIDEMPRCGSMKWEMKRRDLNCILNVTRSNMNTYKRVQIPVEFDKKTGKVTRSVEYDQVVDKYPEVSKFTADDADYMYDRYVESLKGTEYDPIKGTRSIDDLNRRFLIEQLYSRFDEITSCPGINKYNDGFPNVGKPSSVDRLPETVRLCYNLSSLFSRFMQTRLWVFDGTGDLAFSGSKDLDIYSPIPDHISPSRIRFHKIDISSGRLFKEDTLMRSSDKIVSLLRDNLNTISNVINLCPNGKFLIVTWKNLKFSRCASGRFAEYTGDERSLIPYLTNNNRYVEFDLVRYYKDMIGAMVEEGKRVGTLSPDFEFDVIHYQSGKDRATNDYRNYDSIIFMGKFYVPRSAIDEHNFETGANTDHTRYTILNLVQAIYRTRIRNHTGEPIDVYFSNDWDERYMILTSAYLSDDMFISGRRFVSNSNEAELLKDSTIEKIKACYNSDNRSLRDLGFLNPNWQRKLKCLFKVDPKLEEAIITGSSYTMDITLNDLSKALPMGRKKKDAYRALIKCLDSLNIKINIIS